METKPPQGQIIDENIYSARIYYMLNILILSNSINVAIKIAITKNYDLVLMFSILNKFMLKIEKNVF